MKASEYTTYDALGLSALVRQGEVKRSELLAAAIDIAERQNPKINAICYAPYEEVMAETQAKDDEPSNDRLFDGVPFLLKDLAADYKGWPHTFASRALSDNVSLVTDELVTRFIQSGVTIFGRTTSPEFGFIPFTESELHGITRNPWSLNHNPGGSSGGSAAAVAAGITPIAHANDGGGSIRIPASCCGLVGMKPSRGRTPVGMGAVEIGGGIVYQHVVSKTVRDCAAMLDSICGPELGSIYHPPKPSQPFQQYVNQPPGRLKVAYWTKYLDRAESIHPECVSAVEKTAKLLESLGHIIEEKRPHMDFEALQQAFLLQWSSGAAAQTRTAQLLKPDLDPDESFEPFIHILAQAGNSASAADLFFARNTFLRSAQEMERFHLEYDVFVTTVIGTPPLEVGGWPRDAIALGPDTAPGKYMHCSQIMNCSGQPSISLPLHETKDGLPVGVMISAAYGREDLLYQLAGQLEQAAPWRDRQAPNFG